MKFKFQMIIEVAQKIFKAAKYVERLMKSFKFLKSLGSFISNFIFKKNPMSTKEMVSELASIIYKSGKTMNVNQLADFLNMTGFRTTYGAKYAGGRGMFKLIREAYWSAVRSGNFDEEAIAKAFTNMRGGYPYNK